MNEIKFDLELDKENAIYQLKQLIDYSKAIKFKANAALEQMRQVQNEEEFNAQVNSWPEVIGMGFAYNPRVPEED